jgi:hypothetical protein
MEKGLIEDGLMDYGIRTNGGWKGYILHPYCILREYDYGLKRIWKMESGNTIENINNNGTT